MFIRVEQREGTHAGSAGMRRLRREERVEGCDRIAVGAQHRLRPCLHEQQRGVGAETRDRRLRSRQRDPCLALAQLGEREVVRQRRSIDAGRRQRGIRGFRRGVIAARERAAPQAEANARRRRSRHRQGFEELPRVVDRRLLEERIDQLACELGIGRVLRKKIAQARDTRIHA